MRCFHEAMRCSQCRDGRVGAEEWTAWYCRADEVRAELSAVQGNLGDPEAYGPWEQLLDERPTCDEEQDCPACGGAGLVADEPQGLLAAPAR
jgi:hypothetical protein